MSESEQGRVSEETGRGTAEGDRVIAEEGRVMAEKARVKASSRVSGEEVTAEGGRVTAEEGRVAAEEGRVEEARQPLWVPRTKKSAMWAMLACLLAGSSLGGVGSFVAAQRAGHERNATQQDQIDSLQRRVDRIESR